MVSKLRVEDNIKTKPLYTQVFNEDTKEFIEYYYSEIGSVNTMYTIDDKAMLHLNPFKMSIYGHQSNVNYIVAVATKEEYRKKGLMKQLMIKALQDMYDDGQPFTYLMPAAEAIYEPFDFIVVGEQHYYGMNDESCDLESITSDGMMIKEVTPDDCVDLANFSNELIKEQSSIYTLRTTEYFTRILKEQQVQNGGVKIYLKDNQIQAVVSYSMEDDLKLRDVLKRDHISLPFKAVGNHNMMARIINLREFIKCVPFDVIVKKELEEFNLVDTILEEQTGYYKIMANGDITFSKDIKTVPTYSVEELTKIIFENTSVVLNEIV